jgi:hypothetical protein
MERLNLSIPEQHGYNDPTVERDVDRLQAWLTNLPLMDVVETVRLVLGGLQSLNEQRLETGLRYRLLDVFRSTAHRLFVTVDPMHLRQLTLAKTQREQATEGVEQLLLAMAGGYKLIISELYSAGDPGVSREVFGLSLNRGLEQLGYALLDSYRYYRAVQPDLFAELHQLYRLARHHGLLGVMTDDEDDAERQVTTAARYHAVLLLSLTDPFRLAEGEVSMLQDVLVQHAGRCRVIPGNCRDDMEQGLFFIDLRGNGPPIACSGTAPPADAAEPYLLDARDALQAIRERLAKTPVKVRTQSPEAMVLRRLLPEDPGTQQRRESRYPDSRWVQLLLGMEHIHAWLARAAGKDKGTVVGEPSACRVIDTSEHGMGLAWEGGGTGDARVGELLCVIEDGGQPRMAIVRSIRVYREGGMELGVQLIPGISAPVYCRHAGEGDDRSWRALFMPASSDEQVGATIIATKGLYEQGRRLLIDVAGREVRARAGRCVFDGPVFDRFEFSSDDDE